MSQVMSHLPALFHKQGNDLLG